MRHPRRRDRRGRGPRGPVLPRVTRFGAPALVVPAWRSRAAAFDRIVAGSFADLDAALVREAGSDLESLELVVQDVPELLGPGEDGVVSDETGGQAVPLGRVLRPGPTGVPRLVVYRRPVEARAVDGPDLEALVHDVLVELVAELLGVDPGSLEP